MEKLLALVKSWTIKARGENNPFFKFFMYYLCLDAIATSLSNCSRDYEKINWLIQNNSILKKSWEKAQSSEMLSTLEELSSLQPVQDMRPGREGAASLKNVDDFGQVINLIYQIRCNLFHGAKDLNNKRDIELVTLGSKILEYWFTVVCTEL